MLKVTLVGFTALVINLVEVKAGLKRDKSGMKAALSSMSRVWVSWTLLFSACCILLPCKLLSTSLTRKWLCAIYVKQAQGADELEAVQATISFMYNSIVLLTSVPGGIHMWSKLFYLYNKVEHFMFYACSLILCSSKNTESFPLISLHKFFNSYKFGFALTSLIPLKSRTVIWSVLLKLMTT